MASSCAFSAALIYFIQSVASLQQLHAIVFYLMGRVPSLDRATLGLLTLADCFEAEELLMKQSLIDKYFPKKEASET